MLLLLVAVLLVSLAYLLWTFRRKSKDSLDWETGRRKARQSHKRTSEFYEFYGVTSAEEYYVNSRGVELFAKEWLPVDGRLRGVVFYCHGYGDTCSYAFEDVALRLAASGYAVHAIDYEGHGLSAGLHGFIPRFQRLPEDVLEWAAVIRARPASSHLPFFVYGESMGGAVALLAHLQQPSFWQGAVLVAPMCKIATEMMPAPPVVAALSFLARFFPRAQLVPTRDISEAGFRDPAKRERLCQNPVGYAGRPRLQTALQMLQATKFIGSSLEKVSVPLVVLHGAADVVTDPSISEALYARASSLDKSFRLYEGCWHGLTSAEPDEMVERVMGDVVSWLHARSLPPGVIMSRRGAAVAAAAVAVTKGLVSDMDSLMDSRAMAELASSKSSVMESSLGSPESGDMGMWGAVESKRVPWHLLPADEDDASSISSCSSSSSISSGACAS